MIGIASAVVTDALRKAVAAGSVNGQTTEEIVDEHARPVVAMLDELVTLREAAVETEAEQRARGNEWRTRAQAAEAEVDRLREDAERFRALMRCGRIKPQGSAGVDPRTGVRLYPDHPGSVHFGAEFWVAPDVGSFEFTAWGRHCLRALADDIIAFEAMRAEFLASGEVEA